MPQSKSISNNTNFPTFSINRETEIIWLTTFAVVCFMIVLLNVITILTFVLNRPLRRRSVYCLINIAVADMMYGGFSVCEWSILFLKEANKLEWEAHWELFNIIEIAAVLSLMASILSLMDVAIERWFAMFFPFRHRRLGTKVYALLFFKTWALAALVSFLINLFKTFYAGRLLYWITIGSSLITIFISYLFILLKVRSKNDIQVHQGPEALRAVQKRESDLATTLFIVTICSLITWMPFFIFRATTFKHNAYFVIRHFPIISRFLFLLQTLNSLINPIIYVLRVKEFRRALVGMFHLGRCSRQQDIHQSDRDHAANEPAIELNFMQHQVESQH